jgi:hypothetical protein
MHPNEVRLHRLLGRLDRPQRRGAAVAAGFAEAYGREHPEELTREELDGQAEAALGALLDRRRGLAGPHPIPRQRRRNTASAAARTA